MKKADAIRNVFREPEAGDAIKVYGDTYEVTKIERHPGKVYVHVRINDTVNRVKIISLDSWRAYSDDAQVVRNGSVVDVFDVIE